MFAGVGERTREGNDLYREMIESVSDTQLHGGGGEGSTATHCTLQRHS